MANALELTVVTPERALIRETVDEVQVPGLNGYLGLLPGHAPLFSELSIGELSYVRRGEKTSIALAGGFIEISDDNVHVLAGAAEPAAEIDVERASAARSRADEWISKGGEDVDYARALDARKRAEVRLSVAERH
jgi:F-type H+-transporting ATPase subunit epsilon